ncbi:MAG: hypothetical protein GY786_14750 [Proteobacteria bacterium]|nr:hypothetical protein [Pseudomonadota bacterium]
MIIFLNATALACSTSVRKGACDTQKRGRRWPVEAWGTGAFSEGAAYSGKISILKTGSY